MVNPHSTQAFCSVNSILYIGYYIEGFALHSKLSLETAKNIGQHEVAKLCTKNLVYVLSMSFNNVCQ